MRIRVLQNFDCYERGQVFEDWPGGMCDILIRRGLVEKVETAEAVADSVEHADMTYRPAQKKRR